MNKNQQNSAKKEVDLFFTPYLNIFDELPFLDITDRELLRVIHRQKNESLQISIRDLCSFTGAGKTQIMRSIEKLLFSKLIIKLPVIKADGNNGTPIYKTNHKREYWVLTKKSRELLNQQEKKKDLPITRNENDFSSTLGDYVDLHNWFKAFETSLSPYLRLFFNENMEVRESKRANLNKIITFKSKRLQICLESERETKKLKRIEDVMIMDDIDSED